ncbi:hypothetical protein QLX08_006700 [Tetragonisca angustula]|uniref:Kinetochore protein SPC25 n=1 Tax=Tetragonisca angustula TaxID=166442 RepID=A0AAW0ZSF0_9HYME
MEEFNVDIVHVLQNRDFSVLQKLIPYLYDFRAKIAAKVEDATAYESKCMKKRTQSESKISELQQEIESLKTEIDATKLQQKIVDKKIANAIKQEEELEEEVNGAKLTRDNLTIEIVDLREKSEQRKAHKKSTWDGIKRACKIYRQYLDFHIHLIHEKEGEQLKVSFFVNDSNTENEYFVRLLNWNNQWKVEQIQPPLKEEHLTDFERIIDFSKQSRVSDMTAFLCKLRYIFTKYYLNVK